MTTPRTLRLWAQGDAHVGRDLQFGRTSLSDALSQSEFGGDLGGPSFDWDFAVNVGDYCGYRDLPSDAEGKEIIILMLSDVNEKSHKKGRGELEGNPGGVVTQETFKWWQEQVLRHRDKIVITAHHYVLKETTFASGLWEGMRKDPDGKWIQDYHRYIEEGSPAGASFLCWVGGRFDSGQFESFLNENPGAVDMWFGGHTHSNPEDRKGGRGCFERRYGNTMFMNICALTRYMVPDKAIPHSWLLTFTTGSDQVRAQCYMHTDEYRPQGWYDTAEQWIDLTTAFQFNA